MKIFFSGMKTGSTSIHESLKNQYKSIHGGSWSKNYFFEKNIKLLKNNQIFSGGILNSEFAKKANKKFANCKFIIMDRDDNSWIRSYISHKEKHNIKMTVEKAWERKKKINKIQNDLEKYLSQENIPYIKIDIVNDCNNSRIKLINFLKLNKKFILKKTNRRDDIKNTFRKFYLSYF